MVHSLTVHLPDELWLLILQELPYEALRAIRSTNRQFFRIATDVLIKQLPEFSLSFTFPLNHNTDLRWYGIRTTVHLSFDSVSPENSRFALFSRAGITPEKWGDRGLRAWGRICQEGFDRKMVWKIQRQDTEEVRYVKGVKLISIVAAKDHGVWCDWKEVLNAYYGGLASSLRTPSAAARHGMFMEGCVDTSSNA